MNNIKLQQSKILDNSEKTLLSVFINKKTLTYKLKQVKLDKYSSKLFNAIQQIETNLGEEKALKYLYGHLEYYNLELYELLKN